MCNSKQLWQSEETKAMNENEKQEQKETKEGADPKERYSGESRRFKERDWMVET